MLSCWTWEQTGGLTRLGVAQNRGAAAEGGAAAVVAAAATAAAQAAAPDPHHHPDLLGRTHWRREECLSLGWCSREPEALCKNTGGVREAPSPL